jgi:ribosomal protein S25
MVEFLLVFIGFLGGAIFMWLWHKGKFTPAKETAHWEQFFMADKTKAEKKQPLDVDKIEKIMKVLETSNHVTCDGVEEMLGVSHDIAEQYLVELEQAGRLTHVGEGRSVVIYKKK